MYCLSFSTYHSHLQELHGELTNRATYYVACDIIDELTDPTRKGSTP